MPARKKRARVVDHQAEALAEEAAIAAVRRMRAKGEALDLKAALDAVRGGPLDVQAAAAIAQGDLTKLSMVYWTLCVSQLADLAQHAPELGARIQAGNLGAQRSCDMMRLIAEAQGKVGGQGATQPPAMSPADDATANLTTAEKVAILRARLKVAT